MAKDVGPEMLAKLDRQREAGEIDQYQYDVRRDEVMRLIRKGKTIELNAKERWSQLGLGALGVVVGFTIIGIVVNLGWWLIVGWIFGIIAAIPFFVFARRIGRRVV